MKLTIKEEYLEYSIGGGRMRAIKLRNIPVGSYQKYYDLGYTQFFDVEDTLTKKKKSDDKNNTGNDSISLFNTDGEGNDN